MSCMSPLDLFLLLHICLIVFKYPTLRHPFVPTINKIDQLRNNFPFDYRHEKSTAEFGGKCQCMERENPFVICRTVVVQSRKNIDRIRFIVKYDLSQPRLRYVPSCVPEFIFRRYSLES